jgi:hypothetical protein
VPGRDDGHGRGRFERRPAATAVVEDEFEHGRVGRARGIRRGTGPVSRRRGGVPCASGGLDRESYGSRSPE